jgi:hypothetical protein
LLEKKKMLGETLEIEVRKHLKRKCKSGKAKAGAKSERVKWELEGKLFPCSWFCLVVSLFVLSSQCLRRRK